MRWVQYHVRRLKGRAARPTLRSTTLPFHTSELFKKQHLRDAITKAMCVHCGTCWKIPPQFRNVRQSAGSAKQARDSVSFPPVGILGLFKQAKHCLVTWPPHNSSKRGTLAFQDKDICQQPFCTVVLKYPGLGHTRVWA
eukprot:1158894-Pelagomonas_calceolata.AAC.1